MAVVAEPLAKPVSRLHLLLDRREVLETILVAPARSQAYDGKQGVRLKRYLMALAAYCVCTGLLAIAHWLGLIPARPAITAAVAMLAANAAIFVLIRTGINERFQDPSLTWMQVISAIAVIMYVTYYSDSDRALPLMVSLLVLSFGAFRFTMRDFLLASGIVLAAYAAVITGARPSCWLRSAA